MPGLPSGKRLESLDILRGLTVVGMLLVNDPGSGDHVYKALRHADWNGWHAADLVFPFFLFIVGITTQLSLTSRAERGATDADIRRQILRRGALLFGIGLLLNWFPFYEFGTVAGHAPATFLDHVVARLEVVRFLGILQRISLAYMEAAFLTWRAGTRRVAITIAVILLGYWLIMTLAPIPNGGGPGYLSINDPSRNLAAWVDRFVLDWSRWGLGNHIWDGSVTLDPEGLLSTIPAVATAMLGVLAGRWLAQPRPLMDRINGLFAAGALGTIVGLCWGFVLPINKKLWSSSYVLFTAGAACLALAAIMWLVDVHRRARWLKPFNAYGANAIVAFVGAELMAMLLSSTIRVPFDGRKMGVPAWVYGQLALWLDPRSASAMYALLFTAAWYPVLRALQRRGVIVRI